MKKLSDEELLEELKSRISERKQAYLQLEKLNAELHDANRKLIESEKLKSNFLSNARNEVINPLSSILSLSQAIATADDTGPESRKLAGIVYRSAFDLDFQMNNIFSSAEIEAGEAACEYYDIDLTEMAEKSVEKFTELAAGHGHSLVFERPARESETPVRSDPSKVQLILDNLIVNAVQWSKNPGEIRIKISSGEKYAVISVSDPGPGIDEKYRQEIFNRFKTIDPTVHTQNKGHGLGLSIVHAYVEMLDGSISLESSVDGGSIFTIEIMNQSESGSSQGSSGSGSEFLFDSNPQLF